ncbi:hypothetical protein D3C72_939630 [compost metagenome]
MTNMFEKLMMSNNMGRLTSQETDYWKMFLGKVLKVGEEYEVVIPNDHGVSDTIRSFQHHFRPSGRIDHPGQHGIYDIKQDGSVPHGLELVTAGRRFDWKVFYNMNKKIMDKFQEIEMYTTYHTGMHIHILAGYNEYDTELERNVPEIILANYYQLHRIFAPELFFMASSGTTRHGLTRYTLFRRPPFDFSPLQTSMRSIREQMSAKYGKYQMINLNPLSFSDNTVSRFHVEIRYPDTLLSPSYASAIVALEVALLNKAIDLSQIGLISMKQIEYDYRKRMFDKFANLGTGDRDSDTSELTDDDIKRLSEMASEMVKWLKSEIVSINPTAYEILQKIALEPASLMRVSGKSWRMIEEHLYSPEIIDNESMDKIKEIIIMQQITDCDNTIQWKNKVSSRVGISQQKVGELITKMGTEKVMVFDKEIGAMLFKQLV